MTQIDTKKITGVPETLLIPLYCRAMETQRPDGIIRDEKAVEVVERFPHAESLFEANAPMTVGRAKRHDALSRTETQSEFKWGPASGAVCETWDARIRFVQEWNYLDRHRERWRYMGLFAYIPPLRRGMMNKIVHLKST